MLEAAIVASASHPMWESPFLPDTAREDLLWLMKRSNYLGDKRDEAIHAPCNVFHLSQAEGVEVIVGAHNNHRRAKALQGKELLVEFDWLERYIGVLAQFTDQAFGTISFTKVLLKEPHPGSAPSPWPQRPRVPDRQPKTFLRRRFRRSLPK